jgi:dephospho-CoA kinase
MLFGVIGLNGSGKDTVADYLVEKYSFVHYGCGQAVRDELKKQGKDYLNRENMIDLANKMRKEKGNDYWAKYIFEKFFDSQDLIISSIRNPAEINFIKSKGGKLIRVDAEQKTRFERVSKRAEDSSKHGSKDFEEFKRLEKIELESSDPSKQQLLACLEKADYSVDNSSSLEELYPQIDSIIKKEKNLQDK